MTRSEARRAALVEALVEAMADHLLAEGLTGASLRPLAKAAGLSDRMLLYYFDDKAAAMHAALGCVVARFTAALDAHRAPRLLPRAELERGLVDVLRDPAVWPAMQLWLEIVAAAARGDAVYGALGKTIAHGFLDWVAGQLDAPADAVDVLAVVEGRLVLRAVGLG